MKKKLNRRDFLKRSALVTAGTLMVPRFLKAVNSMESVHQGQKILVVIQLGGGNDGLNTVVPYADDRYYHARPRLGIKEDEVIKLTDRQGVNPALEPLRSLYDEGEICILNSVGYPEPNRSHFRSMDIWQSGSASSQYLDTGWLGRFMDQARSSARGVIEVSDNLSLALKGHSVKGLAVRDAKRFYQTTASERFKTIAKAHQDDHDHPQVAYLYKTLNESISSAEYIFEKNKTAKPGNNYPQNPLAKDLRTVATMIKTGMDTRVYYVSVGGFDTHVNQPMQHKRLLGNYAGAFTAFADDLRKADRWKDVVVMTFSEFGRRVKQNASNGTDHGTANNLFLAGGSLKKAGIFNEAPDLGDLDKGDLKYQLDFRQVYAELLNGWLGADAGEIVSGPLQRLGIV